jgi:hypothetical protein
VVQTRKTQGARKNHPAATAPAATCTDKQDFPSSLPSSSLISASTPLPEIAPDVTGDDIEDISKRPERQAREGFTTMLAQIVEESEFDEADRTIGNYEFRDKEWESWKAGLVRLDECDNEYDVGSDSDSDGIQSVATAGTKPQTGKSHKTKATRASRGSKRKHRDLDLDSDGDMDPDSESESEVESECVPSLDAKAA